MLNKKILLFIFSILLLPVSIFAYDKNEFVYTNIDSNGKESDKIVNNELLLKDKGTIEDETYLKDILNINGDESFSLKNNRLLWKSIGNSIMYQGKIDKKNPVNVDIKYYLNDKEVKYKDILNKSGNITIKYIFDNTMYNSEYGLHTPFVMSMGCILKDKSIKDISINNGKVINIGNRFVIVGIAAPGLYDDLKLDKLSSLDTIEINYKTDKFKMGEVYLVGSPKVLDETDLDVFNRLDNGLNQVNLLQSGINKISNGSNQLKNGLNKYNSNFKTYKDGINRVNNGSNELASKYNELDNGINTLYSKVNGSLDSVNSLKEGSNDVSNGVNELTNSTYNLYSNLINKYKENNSIINSLSEKYNTCIQVISMDGVDETTKNNCMEVISGYNQLNGANSAISTIVTSSLGIPSMDYADYALNQMKSTKLDKLNDGANAVSNGNSLLNSNLNEMNNGLYELKNGSSLVKDSLNTLANGTNKINNATKELYDGSNKLLDGINSLDKGINEFNGSGISKLSNLSNKVKGYSNKFKNLVKLSKSYNGFSSDNATNTTFIYKVNY